MMKRADDRKDTQLPARIVTETRTLECVVRDVSVGGARLRVTDPSTVPQEFQLEFQKTGELRRAKVQWRRAKDVGIAFLKDRRVFGRRQVPPQVIK